MIRAGNVRRVSCVVPCLARPMNMRDAVRVLVIGVAVVSVREGCFSEGEKHDRKHADMDECPHKAAFSLPPSSG